MSLIENREKTIPFSGDFVIVSSENIDTCNTRSCPFYVNPYFKNASYGTEINSFANDPKSRLPQSAKFRNCKANEKQLSPTVNRTETFWGTCTLG